MSSMCVSEFRETLLTQQWCFWNKSPKSLCIILLDSCPDTASMHSKRQAAMRTKQRNGNSWWRMRGFLLEAKHWITQHNRVSRVWTKHYENMVRQLETLRRNGQKNKQKLVFSYSICIFLISNQFEVTQGWKAYSKTRENDKTIWLINKTVA